MWEWLPNNTAEIIPKALYREKDERKLRGRSHVIYQKGLHAPWLAVLCAFFIVTQIMEATSSVQHHKRRHEGEFWRSHLTTGIALVLIIFVITLGGLKRLAHVAQRLVPTMALILCGGRASHHPGQHHQGTGRVRGHGCRPEPSASGHGWRRMGSMLIAMQKGVARGPNSMKQARIRAGYPPAAQVNHPVNRA